MKAIFFKTSKTSKQSLCKTQQLLNMEVTPLTFIWLAQYLIHLQPCRPEIECTLTLSLCSHYWFTFGQHAPLEELSLSPSNSVVFIWALWLLVTWWASLPCAALGKFNHLALIFRAFHQLTLKISFSGALLKHRECLFSLCWCLPVSKWHKYSWVRITELV